MLFWHLGATSFLFRWIFRDPLVDLRWLWLGALAPNLVDIPVAAALGFPDDAYRLWGHTMLFPIVLMGAVLVLTRRGDRRTKLLALTVGVFFHLALDRMWVLPETLLWPVLGRAFGHINQLVPVQQRARRPQIRDLRQQAFQFFHLFVHLILLF